MIHLIQSISNSRWCWIALCLLGIMLEACGLYFQYGLRLDPCVNCVYERALYLTFIGAGLIGFLAPQVRLLRVLATLIFLVGSASGVLVALSHLADYSSAGFGSCALRANFPYFLPLDKWLPWMFQPTGACVPLDWSLLGLNMPQWILISFACGLVVALVFLFAECFRRKKRDYMRYYR